LPLAGADGGSAPLPCPALPQAVRKDGGLAQQARDLGAAQASLAELIAEKQVYLARLEQREQQLESAKRGERELWGVVRELQAEKERLASRADGGCRSALSVLPSMVWGAGGWGQGAGWAAGWAGLGAQQQRGPTCLPCTSSRHSRGGAATAWHSDRQPGPLPGRIPRLSKRAGIKP
jgi:hypothetical protein